MLVETLPEYTTERYYLLSEIEQHVKYVLLNEKNDLRHRTKFGVVYMLWNESTPFEIFKLDVEKLVVKSEKYIKNFQNSLLAIELLISSEWGSFQPQVQQLLTWVNESFAFGCVLVGVSNNVAGTPALEKCHEYCEFLYKDNEITQPGKIYVITPNREQLLGHDPTREPDAGSGVFQVICTDLTAQNYTFDEWLKQTKEQLIVGHWMETEEKVNEAKVKPNNPELIWFLFFGVLGAIIASAAHIIYTR